MFVFVPVLQFHCRWEVVLLAVMMVCVAAPAFARRSAVLVAGRQWLGAGPTISTL